MGGVGSSPVNQPTYGGHSSEPLTIGQFGCFFLTIAGNSYPIDGTKTEQMTMFRGSVSTSHNVTLAWDAERTSVKGKVVTSYLSLPGDGASHMGSNSGDVGLQLKDGKLGTSDNFDGKESSCTWTLKR